MMVRVGYIKYKNRDALITDVVLEESEFGIFQHCSDLEVIEGKNIQECLKKARDFDYVYADFGFGGIAPFVYRERNDLAFNIILRVNMITMHISHFIVAFPLFREGDLIIAGCESVKKDLLLVIPFKDVKVIPYGFDIGGLSKFTREKDPHKLLYLGRLSPEKGVHKLIKAMEFLKDTDLFLVIAGPKSGNYLDNKQGVYYAVLQRLVEKLSLKDKVIFKGIVRGTQKYEEIASSRLVINPSLARETFGRVNIEALACDVPVICSDTPAFREVLSDQAVFFDPRPEAIADVIRKAIDKEIRVNKQELLKFDFKAIAIELQQYLTQKKQVVSNKLLEGRKLKDFCSLEIAEFLKNPEISYDEALQEVLSDKSLLDMSKLESLSRFLGQVKYSFLFF